MSATRSRKPFPQLNDFRSWVTDELRRRKTQWPTPTHSPFVRLTSCNEDTQHKYKYFTLGLHGFSDQSVSLFEPTHGSKKDIVGYAYRTANGRSQKVLIGSDEITYVSPTQAGLKGFTLKDIAGMGRRITQAQTQQSKVPVEGVHPIPGITHVGIQRRGLVNPLIAEVRWNCYNQQQFEFLRNHFLVIGSYVVLEWGQQTSIKSPIKKLLNFGSNKIDRELLDSIVFGRRYVIENFAKPNNGNYDFLVGQLGNFSIEIEPHTNIYKCSMKIVSVGENVWGLNSSMTFTNQRALPGDPNAAKLSNIHDYFAPGGRYDQFLGKIKSQSSKVITPASPAFKEGSKTVKTLFNVNPNPRGNTFISWDGLTNDVLNDINEMFASVTPNKDIQRALDNFRKELQSLLGLGGPPSSLLRKEIFEEQNKMYENDWIGNHKFLRSTDPEIMVLITSDLAKLSPSPEWLQAGIFGQPGGEDRGKLVNGIWLNAEMVRQAFLSTQTLQAAFTQILSKLNESVADYWSLQLFYDDEVSVYKVIDHKFSEDARDVPFYVFNSNKNTHHNEVLNIEFNTAFPPELITQMMSLASIRTSSPEKQAALFKDVPLINNTSPFAMAVNWTSLKDILKEKVQAYRDGINIDGGITTNVQPLGTGVGQSTTPSVGTRVVGNSIAPQVGSTAQFASMPGTTRTISNTIPKSIKTSEIGDPAPKPRKNAFPPSQTNLDAQAIRAGKRVPFRTLKLDSLPIEPLVITSRRGNREAPTEGGSKDHKGVDIRANQDPIKAVKNGLVVIAGAYKGYGNAVKIKHADGFDSVYGHLETVNVSVGEKVSAGQVIGISGDTGISSAPHLHFELRYLGQFIDPEPALSSAGPLNYKQRDGSIAANPPTEVMPSSGRTPALATMAPAHPLQQDSSKKDAVVMQNQEGISAAEQQRIDKFYKDVQEKFGSGMTALIAPSKSILRNWITSEGYSRLGKTLINGFVSPFPTLTNVEITVQGISGISISDGFFVDKLPFIFAQFGLFQVHEIADNITETGWTTSLKGYFRMVWPDGRGGQRTD